MKNLAALRARRHVKCHARCHSWDLDICTENKLRIRDEHLAVQIFAVTLETRVLFNFEYDENVAATTTAGADVAGSSHRHVLTGRNTGRNMNFDFFILS